MTTEPANKASFVIEQDVDVIWARQQAVKIAQDGGFNRRQCGEISIATSEMGTNILKYGKEGTLTISLVGPQIQIEAMDTGPGIPDIDMAMEDGFSEGRFLAEDETGRKKRGLGAGLGAIERLMDEVRIENRPEGGLRVTATKYLK